jgi:hypothetical protein
MTRDVLETRQLFDLNLTFIWAKDYNLLMKMIDIDSLSHSSDVTKNENDKGHVLEDDVFDDLIHSMNKHYKERLRILDIINKVDILIHDQDIIHLTSILRPTNIHVCNVGTQSYIQVGKIIDFERSLSTEQLEIYGVNHSQT